MNKTLTPEESVDRPLPSSNIIPDDPENSMISRDTGVYVTWNLFYTLDNSCLKDSARKCPFSLVDTSEVQQNGQFETVAVADFNHAIGITIQDINNDLGDDPDPGRICRKCRFRAREIFADTQKVA